MPSHTSLSGDKAHYVMIDASISNEIFAPNKAYRPAEEDAQYDDNLLMAIGPDGKPISDNIRAYFLQRKNSAAVKLTSEGTYHIAMKREPRLMTFYKDDKNGFFSTTWQHPGLYLIEASVSEEPTEKA
ncbi:MULTISPECIES: hypothetical protein [Pseudoalteromonas]|uniref:hypothetical protein n=1 Tax=Pseudoalteromonas TaxID=53246 RepID=UPI0030CA4805